MKEFVELCHYFGIKIIPYCSASYIHEGSKYYREEFSRSHGGCIDMHYKYRYGWAGSEYWRDFIIPRTFNIMDTYGFDGIFNDWGYDWEIGTYINIPPERRNYELQGLDRYDPEAEDLIHILYDGIKSRGGIDYSEPWYYSAYMETLSIGKGTRFFIAGDVYPIISSWTQATFWNKTVYGDSVSTDMTSLYKLVEDGGWTFDEMQKMCTMVYSDLDADHVVSAGDRIGACNSVYGADHLAFSISKQNDGFNRLCISVCQERMCRVRILPPAGWSRMPFSSDGSRRGGSAASCMCFVRDCPYGSDKKQGGIRL